MSYDNYHSDLDRLYRIAKHSESPSLTADFAAIDPVVRPILTRDFPQVESAARLQRIFRPLVKSEDRMFYETRCFHAEPELFKIFSYNFVKGNPATALSRPRTLVISESMAERYFDDEDPLGKTLEINSEHYEITGIFEDYPSNTHLKCDLIGSFITIENEDINTSWGWENFYT